MAREPKKPVADISVNTHININNHPVSIQDALKDKKLINNIIPDDHVFLVISQREFLCHMQSHYKESFQHFKKLQFKAAAQHRAIATKLKLIFNNSRIFCITGKQYKQVKRDEEVLRNTERQTRYLKRKDSSSKKKND
jgi:hypothetical protein